MTLFQIFALLFGLWMIYVISIHAKKQVLSQVEFWFWVSLWSLFIVIALFPALLLGISNQLYFSRVFDLLVVGALTVLSIMIFVSYFGHKETQLKLNELIKETALKEGRKQIESKKVKDGE